MSDIYYKWDYYKDFIGFLYQNIERNNRIDYEDYDSLDLLSRAFAAILEDGIIDVSREELDKTKQALIPLWELTRFEARYIPDAYLF